MGTSFQARYLKIILEDVKKLNYGDGVWIVALSEIAAYDNIVVKSETTLISTNELDGALSGGEATVIVLDTTGFTDSGTAYLDPGDTDDEFTYSGRTATTFTGCSGVGAHADGTKVAQSLETATTLYDHLYLLPSLGDKLYKDIRISEEVLYSQSQLDDLSKNYLEEFVKEHTKRQIDIVFAPYLKIGQTVSLTDTYNNETDVKYFVSSISNTTGYYSLVLARYPG